jgi:hypothetical protein
VSSTPPEEQQQPRPYGGYGRPGANIGAIMPIPGNAEIVVYVIAAIILAIVALAADDFDAHGWSVAFTWITAAYLVSRGIAKASRVLER